MQEKNDVPLGPFKLEQVNKPIHIKMENAFDVIIGEPPLHTI